jgi:hypothetical protein
LVILIMESAILSGQDSKHRCIVDSREYPGEDNAMWDALYAAKNGTVYTGLITEGGSERRSHLFLYIPKYN